MGFKRHFVVRLAWRTAVLIAASVAAAALAAWGRAPTAAIVAGVLALVAGGSIWRLIDESNDDLARFVAALDHGDLTQNFARPGRGAAFERIGAAYDRALARLRQERARESQAARFGEALADGAPVALLVIDASGEVTFANRAARQLFGRAHPCPIAALAPFGQAFVAVLEELRPGPTRVVHLAVGGLLERVALDAVMMDLSGPPRRIVAVKVIQAELDRAELSTQVDLVRVLTHEIMNSLTPVTSLAATATGLLAAVDASRDRSLADAQLAVEALARRATELERFVDSYKGFSEAPSIDPEPIAAREWIERVARLFRATPIAATTTLDMQLPPAATRVRGDVALLTQVLINLLKNAAEAAGGEAEPRVSLRLERLDDGRTRIVVGDNGPGIPAHLAREVFLPFFTTKREGTGVGLSFARQIVLLHGGQIGVGEGPGGRIEVILPAT